MRLKIQEQSELNFVSRIIKSRWVGIGNYPDSEAYRDCLFWNKVLLYKHDTFSSKIYLTYDRNV